LRSPDLSAKNAARQRENPMLTKVFASYPNFLFFQHLGVINSYYGPGP